MSDNINDKEVFIEENKKFIYNTTSNVCKKKLYWENDDELSIAMIAFNKAYDSYSSVKGNFFSYAKVIIKNALIDYFRNSSSKYYLTFNSEDEKEPDITIKNSIKTYELQQENKIRSEELAHLCKELSEYKLSLDDLIKSSPSHKDTKYNLLNIAFLCSKDEAILKQLYKNKLLPVKQICILTGSNKKLIEKWRRYLLSLILILSNKEYCYIKSYLNIKAGDNYDN